MRRNLIINFRHTVVASAFAVALGALAFHSTPAARADENLWVYNRGAETLPKGEVEFYYSNIFKIGRNTGSYLGWDMRPEIEYGLTNRLTLSADLLEHYHYFRDIPFDPYTDVKRNKFTFGGFDVKAKLMVLSPYKDWFGLAFGFAYERRFSYRLDGAPTRQNSIKPSVYLQKNFLDDTLIVAATTSLEFERRHFKDGSGILEEEISLEASIGVSYRFAPNWYIGFEVRSQADFLEAAFISVNELNWGRNYQRGIYAGPSIHYGGKHYWATLGVLTQVWGGPDKGSPDSDSGYNWDEHERLHVGFTVGRNF